MLTVVDILIVNAAQLLTMEDGLGLIENGAIAVDQGKIVAVGKTEEVKQNYQGREEIDAIGKVVTPGLIDCHTHLVFAGSREEEYEQRLQGKSYLEILEEGGGILNTVEQTRAASTEDLLIHGQKWLAEFLKYGVTTVEIKSGYGLEYEAEKKMLEVIQLLKKESKQEIVATFLGAHTFPQEFRGNEEEYVKELTERMLPDFRDLAENCDVFIEKGSFSYEQADLILGRAKKLGYNIKLHINQMNQLKGVELAKKYGAVSVEHLDNVSEAELGVLAESGAVAVLLPGASYFLREEQWAPARKIIEKKIPVALSTDFNPGSCPSPNLHWMMSLATQKLGMLPEEVWPAVTINAARALGREEDLGSLTVGKRAQVLVWDMSNYLHPFYHFGENLVEKVLVF